MVHTLSLDSMRRRFAETARSAELVESTLERHAFRWEWVDEIRVVVFEITPLTVVESHYDSNGVLLDQYIANR